MAHEESFIMDVLKNYTTYKRFYGLVKQIENDPQVPKRAAAKVLTQFLTLHPHNIEQVVTIIVEHFRANVMHEIGGRAKAMVVTGSRLEAMAVLTSTALAPSSSASVASDGAPMPASIITGTLACSMIISSMARFCRP